MSADNSRAEAHSATQHHAAPAAHEHLRAAEAPRHLLWLFWGVLALVALAGVVLPLFLKTTPEYVVEQYLLAALLPLLAYTLYKVF